MGVDRDSPPARDSARVPKRSAFQTFRFVEGNFNALSAEPDKKFDAAVGGRVTGGILTIESSGLRPRSHI